MQSVPRSITYDPDLEILVINPIAELVRCNNNNNNNDNDNGNDNNNNNHHEVSRVT